MKNLLTILFATAILVYADPCVLEIGMNLAGPSDYAAEWPLNDIMKYARKWMTHNSTWVEGAANPWETYYEEQIEFDENGYPLEMPVSIEGAETTQVVRTVWANTRALPLGRYTVLYDGTGKLDFYFDAINITESPGHIEFDLRHQDNILGMDILQSQRDDHVRNIRIYMPGYAEPTSPWCEQWLEKLAPFHTLRFMDWGLTNNSTLSKWDERVHPQDYTYTLQGMPYELMIEICNEKMADAWICVPHLADDNYIHQMAQLFRDNLNPELKIYVEYSNENWNWMFDQTHYLNENGNQSVPWPERIVPFIQNVMDIWSQEFDGQVHRLVRVVGVQHAWQDVSNRIVRNMRPGSFDAFSPAAYFGFSDAGRQALTTLGANATADDVIFWAHESMLSDSYQWTSAQARELQNTLNIPMIYYEGGQHLTPEPFGTDQPYNQALMDAQTHPEMYNLYCEWLDSLRTFASPEQPTLFMNFSFIAEKDGKYGSWGLLENQYDSYESYKEVAPKYQAILDNMCEGQSHVQTQHPQNFLLLQNYPNPFNPTTTFAYNLDRTTSVQLDIFNINGQKVATLVNALQKPGQYKIHWDASTSPTGVYFYKLATQQHILTGKCLYLR